MTALACPKCGAELDLNYAMSLTVSRDPNEPPWRRTPLDAMELTCRAHNCLHNMGCETAGDVDDKTDNELLRTPNFGRKCLREVREQLAWLKAQQEPDR
jgi:DNA-directed RNA polymerase alpha subunit